jgi:hypothetical protein
MTYTLDGILDGGHSRFTSRTEQTLSFRPPATGLIAVTADLKALRRLSTMLARMDYTPTRRMTKAHSISRISPQMAQFSSLTIPVRHGTTLYLATISSGVYMRSFISVFRCFLSYLFVDGFGLMSSTFLSELRAISRRTPFLRYAYTQHMPCHKTTLMCLDR